MEINRYSYKDCPWYLTDIDRCHLPSIDEVSSDCSYNNGEELHEFCTSLIEFFKKCREIRESCDEAEASIEIIEEVPEEYTPDSEANNNDVSSTYVSKFIQDMLEKLLKNHKTC